MNEIQRIDLSDNETHAYIMSISGQLIEAASEFIANCSVNVFKKEELRQASLMSMPLVLSTLIKFFCSGYGLDIGDHLNTLGNCVLTIIDTTISGYCESNEGVGLFKSAGMGVEIITVMQQNIQSQRERWEKVRDNVFIELNYFKDIPLHPKIREKVMESIKNRTADTGEKS